LWALRPLSGCGRCATLLNKINWLGENALPSREYMHITLSGARAGAGKSMFRSTQFRFAAIALLAAAAVSLTGASARAFSQGNGGPGGDGNATFADPDEQLLNLFGSGLGAQQFEPSGSAQIGTQQGKLNPFKHFQSNGLTSPPDPLSRPSN
jgi:hypothetical protein